MKDIKYFDTHAHINIEPLDIEIDDIVHHLKEKKTIMNSIGVDIYTSYSSIELSKKYKNIIFASVGIHPKDGYIYEDKIDDVINELDKMIYENRENIICVGEIGLDYYSNDDFDLKKDLQQKLFTKQIELAIKYDLPINIHNRESTDDLLAILDQFKPKKVMIHCFSSTLSDALKFLERDYMISIPGIVTFKNAKNLHDAVKQIPIENLVVETDCPFLTPVPFRGKTNKPYYVEYIVDEIAKIKNIDKDELAKILLKNSLDFFNIKL